MSVFQSILQMFPDARQSDHMRSEDYPHYTWYRDADSDQFIGFSKSSLSNREKDLLSLILTPSAEPPSGPAGEWLRFLSEENAKCPYDQGKVFRMVQYISDTPFQTEGEHALHYVFSNEAIVVQTDEYSGFVIEPQTEDTLALEEMASAAQAIENDLEMKVTFFAGSFHSAGANIKTMLEMERAWFERHIPFESKRSVLSLFDVMPINLMNRFSEFEKDTLFAAIFELFDTERDLPKIIQSFVENLSNVSSTAKLLYMHRNSLQYRLDKFSEKAGIDIKTFNGGLIAYFACLEWNQRISKNEDWSL
ncbi:helix-turn-helix domain-containing protein [Jeotgalibacillus haloalkalitolerans]|uniref:Helix-turn-helix domain-containing protein n=1 Tax=Jeotgalibacillus haloalkalitolerans TaxID=3104292 RepID=A0ABU5KPB1_9BACL|nr:helix-turn-helix domain-containing protein [Jeotgalibacillus sp. HH7-29]MDZ5713093.1 helix-turn-helix domain-containing protein [Jeotgalibacillus sp. HH7-29]